ncbi:DsrE family protein [Sulfuricurvum sp.]|uniref:DsrE family protein n=1 Tax=Sulfuricurvum sp. TaxID=2025608 RepID=UPI00286E21D7|nr:DsrE family protein [Sulfuricurvum sp.]
MKYLIIVGALFSTLLFADVRFAEPIPSIDKPREVVMGISLGDNESIHHGLSTANNVLKFYGPEKIHLRIVAYYHGIRTLLKSEKEIAVRVRALQQYGVEFVACGNTMETKKISPDQLIEDVEIVSAGIAEVIERATEGAFYIQP